MGSGTVHHQRLHHIDIFRIESEPDQNHRHAHRYSHGNFQSPPKATNKVEIVTNLDPSQTSRANWGANPYFALMNQWDGTADVPLASTQYAYSTTLKVYDDIGTAHNLTVYFDQVTLSNAGGDTVWEYIVTCNPSADKRVLSGADGNLTDIGQGLTQAAGLLMTGTMTFTTGTLSSMSAYTLKSNGGNYGGPKNLNNWSLADFSTGGMPVFTANFLGKSNASTAEAANATPIQLSFGMNNKDLSSSGGAWTKGWDVSRGSLNRTAAAIGNRVSNAGWLPNFKDASVGALTSQSFDTGGSSTLFQSQDATPQVSCRIRLSPATACSPATIPTARCLNSTPSHWQRSPTSTACAAKAVTCSRKPATPVRPSPVRQAVQAREPLTATLWNCPTWTWQRNSCA